MSSLSNYSIFLLYALLQIGDCTYNGRRWTLQGTLFVPIDVYSRSPFVMYGRGFQTIYSGYNRGGIWSGGPITPQMYIDKRHYLDGASQWTNAAVMTPPDAVAADIDRQFDGLGNYVDVTISDGSKYGHWISGGGDLTTGAFFAVGAPYDHTYYPDPGTELYQVGAVYMYRGEQTEWTNTQKLKPNDLLPGTRFGSSISICPKVTTNMVIGGPEQESDAGTAYFFTSTPNARYWTQKQKLITSDRHYKDWFGFRVFLYDEFLAISMSLDDDQGVDHGSLYMFRQERAFGLNTWSTQQIIRNPGLRAVQFGEYTSLYGHTLAIGSHAEDQYGGTTSTGAVYVYKTYKTMEMPFEKPPPVDNLALVPRTDNNDEHVAKPKPKPVPMFKWWSQQQKLTPRDWHTYRYFGTFTSLYGDGELIAVGAMGEAFTDTDWSNDAGANYRSGSAYIFVKDNNYDRWTQQQKFISPSPKKGEYFSDPYLHGSDLIIRNTKLGFVYSDNLNWKCLIVSVWDQFGDGWDKTHLIAYAPGAFTKLTDAYSPTCTSKNPLQFRYCPAMPEDEGMYYFKMEDNVFKSQFWAEIRFDIFNEDDGSIYYGDAFTSIGFEWNHDNLKFTHVSSKDDNLVVNSECKACPTPPKPKPGPKPAAIASQGMEERSAGEQSEVQSEARVLKSKDHTVHPTISPAPTLVWATTLDPMRVTMNTVSLGGWHGYGEEGKSAKNGTGTAWYVYDSYGKKLLYTGTICGLGILTYSCHIDYIPDGKYVFRVGGALDPLQGSHSWSFCGRTGVTTSMFSFEIKNRQCIPYNSYTAATYCRNRVGMTLVTSGIIELYGKMGLVLSNDDYISLGVAVSRVFSPVQVKKVTVTQAIDGTSIGGTGTMVKFRASVDIFSLGFDVADDEDMGEIFDVLSEQLEAATMSGQMLNEIVAASEEGAGEHHLMDLRGAKLLTLTNEGLELFSNLVSNSGDADDDVNTAVDVTVDVEDPIAVVVDEIITVGTDSGYVMFGLLFLLVAGVVWRLSVRTNIRQRRPYRGSSNGDIESKSSPEAKKALSRATSEESAADSDQIISDFGLMLSDLKRMAEQEDGVNEADSEEDEEVESGSPVSGSNSSKKILAKKGESAVQVMTDFALMLDDLKRMAEFEDEALQPFRSRPSTKAPPGAGVGDAKLCEDVSSTDGY
jgi:hypothetical protein